MLVAAIVLAAGTPGSAQPPAALLPWDGDDTLIEYQVAQLQAAGVDVIEVVLGDAAERVIALVAADDVEPIVNPRWSEGVAGSVRAGAAAVPRDTETAIVVNVEEPRPAEVYRRLLDEHHAHGAAITRPTFEGTPGTPTVLGRAALAEARNLIDDAPGLRAIIDRHAGDIRDVPFDSEVVLLRVRSAEDCAHARVVFGLG